MQLTYDTRLPEMILLIIEATAGTVAARRWVCRGPHLYVVAHADVPLEVHFAKPVTQAQWRWLMVTRRPLRSIRFSESDPIAPFMLETVCTCAVFSLHITHNSIAVLPECVNPPRSRCTLRFGARA